jgi:hypothetical protein
MSKLQLNTYFSGKIADWFGGLSVDEMCSAMRYFAEVIEARRNYAVVDYIEVVVTPVEIVRLGQLPLLLSRFFARQRGYLSVAKIKCILHPAGTTHDRLRMQRIQRMQRPPKLVPMDALWVPRRGDLSALMRKWSSVPMVNEYSAGTTWIYLGRIVLALAREVAPWHVGPLEFTNLNNTFLTHDCWLTRLLTDLALVCKEWYIVLKYHCMWWGPEGRYFALVPRAKYGPGVCDPTKR